MTGHIIMKVGEKSTGLCRILNIVYKYTPFRE